MGDFCLAVCEIEVVEGRTGRYAFDGTTAQKETPARHICPSKGSAPAGLGLADLDATSSARPS
jgi:hypothetical protein